MRALDVERLAQCAECRHHRREAVRDVLGQRGRRAEPGQVHGYHIALGGQDPDDRVPGLPVVSDAMEQQEGIAGTGAVVRDGDRAVPPGGLDGE
ncbi:hypothetical protein GCM10009612_63650 [Streptomyces beijiangensis]